MPEKQQLQQGAVLTDKQLFVPICLPISGCLALCCAVLRCWLVSLTTLCARRERFADGGDRAACRDLPQLRSRIKQMEEEKERLAEKVEKAAAQAAGEVAM